MTAPRIPRDWTAPLRVAGFEPTELHVHDSAPVDLDDAPGCPPCNRNCNQGRSCPLENQSRWHDKGTHPAEWVVLALAAVVVAALSLSSLYTAVLKVAG